MKGKCFVSTKIYTSITSWYDSHLERSFRYHLKLDGLRTRSLKLVEEVQGHAAPPYLQKISFQRQEILIDLIMVNK